MLLKPQGDTSQGFRREWVRYMEGQPHAAGLNVYVTVDPAHRKKRTSDFTVMAVIAVGGDGTYRLLDVLRDRLNLTERTQALFDLVSKWRPMRVGYERYGLQADIEHIKREQHLANIDFRIVELGGSMSKVDRIRRLIPLFEQGKFILPRTRWRTLSDKTSVDLIDALVEGEADGVPGVRARRHDGCDQSHSRRGSEGEIAHVGCDAASTSRSAPSVRQRRICARQATAAAGGRPPR